MVLRYERVELSHYIYVYYVCVCVRVEPVKNKSGVEGAFVYPLMYQYERVAPVKKKKGGFVVHSKFSISCISKVSVFTKTPSTCQ